MAEEVGILNAILVLMIISFFIVIWVLVKSARRKFIFNGTETLVNATIWLSLAPLAVNIQVLFYLALSNAVVIILLPTLFLAGISAAVGPAMELLGIVFSIVSMKKKMVGRIGALYLYLFCLSLFVSCGFLYLYLDALIPSVLNYYGL